MSQDSRQGASGEALRSPGDAPEAGAPGRAPPVQGVVLSGGGASGAYEVGVLKALLSHGEPPLAPQVFTGTSIGSFNASFLVSQWDTHGRAAIANLESVWLNQLTYPGGVGKTGGVFRIRANPVDLLDPREYVPNPLRPPLRLAQDCIFFFFEALRRASYLATGGETLLQRTSNLLDVSVLLATDPYARVIGNIDFGAIRGSTRQLQIAATNWLTGELRVFGNRDMSDELGPLAIRASSAIPGLLPSVEIGAEPHVDGGVVMNTPLTLGIRAGADELHVVYLDPSVRSIPVASLDSTLDSSYRQQVISWAKVMNEDVDAARRINRSLRALQVLRDDPEHDAREVVWLEREMHVAGMRQLTVHRYHPRDDLAGGALGLLNFDRRHVERLIARGFEDALDHDCDEAKCVLAHAPTPPEAEPPPAAAGGGKREPLRAAGK